MNNQILSSILILFFIGIILLAATWPLWVSIAAIKLIFN